MSPPGYSVEPSVFSSHSTEHEEKRGLGVTQNTERNCKKDCKKGYKERYY